VHSNNDWIHKFLIRCKRSLSRPTTSRRCRPTLPRSSDPAKVSVPSSPPLSRKTIPGGSTKVIRGPPPRRTVGPRASLLRRPIDGGPSRVGCHPAAGSRSGSLLSTVRLARRVEVGAVRQAMDSLYYSRQATRCRRRLSRDDVLLAIRFAVGGTKSLFDPASTRTVFRRAV